MHSDRDASDTIAPAGPPALQHQQVVLVDNSPTSLAMQPDNGIPVRGARERAYVCVVGGRYATSVAGVLMCYTCLCEC